MTITSLTFQVDLVSIQDIKDVSDFNFWPENAPLCKENRGKSVPRIEDSKVEDARDHQRRSQEFTDP